MNKSEYFKKIWTKGQLVCGYSSLKILGVKTALVFERLNTEFNFAVRHNLLIQDYYFAYNEEEIANALGLTTDDVVTAINELQSQRLINTANIDSFKIMQLDLNYICNFISNAERNNNFKDWNFALMTLQASAFNALEFDSENKKNIEKIKNSKYELATDENGNLISF